MSQLPRIGLTSKPRLGPTGKPLVGLAGSPCCCPGTVRICSPSTFVPSDYDLHLRVFDGEYEDDCDTCDKLEASTFVVPHVGGNSYYRQIENFGAACATSNMRWLTLGMVFGCNTENDNWTVKGTVFSQNGIVWWGRNISINGGTLLAIGPGPFITGFNATPFDLGTPDLVVGSEYVLTPLTVFDDGRGGFIEHDCRHANPNVLDAGPKIGITLVPV